MPDQFNALQDTNFQPIIDSLEALKTQVETHESDADAHRLAAEAAKIAAEAAQAAAEADANDADAHRIAAEAAKVAAELAQSIAEQHKDDAELAKIAAEAAASAAEADRIAAQTAKTGAETSETNAGLHELKSQKWAEEDEDVEVETGKYSSKHHRLKTAAHDAAAQAALGLTEQYRDAALDYANLAESYANYKGIWSNLSGALNIPASVFHNDTFWMLLNDVADVTASEPSAGNTDWAAIGATVTSVNGKTGAVVIEITDISGLQADLDSKSDDGHTHTESDITDLDKYSQAEVDAALSGKADDGHNHTESDITDLDKYTQGEVNSLLGVKSNIGHTHTESDITDLDKYTQAQVDAALGNKANASDLINHENDTDDPHQTNKINWYSTSNNFIYDPVSHGTEIQGVAAGSRTITIPTGVNESVLFRQGGAGIITLVEDTGVTINGDTATDGQGSYLVLIPTATANVYDGRLRSAP